MISLFKKKPVEPPYNIHHPDVADKIEFAFEAGPVFRKVKYYRLRESSESGEFNQKTGRYIWIQAFLKQAARKMDDKTLKSFIDDLEKNLSGELNGQINLSKAFQILHTMRAMTNMAFEHELVKRLASVVYFDETEDLRTYSREYGEKKITFWDKHNCLDFFLSTPIAELCNLRGLSVASLESYIQEQTQMIADLSLYTPTSSSGSI